MAAALALVLAGGGLLGWSQLRGEREARVAAVEDRAAARGLDRTVEHIEAAWAQGRDADAVGILRIPRFDRAGRAYSAPVVEGWGDADLARGVGLYADGARPGQPGNVVLAGHRVTHGSPFAAFPTLRVGDTVELRTARTITTYRLVSSGTQYRVPDTTRWPTYATPGPDQRPGRVTGRFLTLVTCAETFHTVMRNVAVAVQVGSRPVDDVTAG